MRMLEGVAPLVARQILLKLEMLGFRWAFPGEPGAPFAFLDFFEVLAVHYRSRVVFTGAERVVNCIQ